MYVSLDRMELDEDQPQSLRQASAEFGSEGAAMGGVAESSGSMPQYRGVSKEG
jgi:hypothetical protein